MKQREYFLYAKNIKITIFFLQFVSVSPHQRSAILDITHQTHAAYALLHPPQHKDAYSTCIYALIWMKITHLCVEADAEERTLRVLDKELTMFCGTPIVFRIFFWLKTKFAGGLVLLWWRVDLSFWQGVSFPAPAAFSDSQHEEDRSHEERRHLLCWVPQSVYPLAASVPHPGPGSRVDTL